MNEKEHDELLDLANDHAEGELSEPQRQRLDDWLQADEGARRIFADFMHDHAALYWDQVSETPADVIDFPASSVLTRLNGVWGIAAAVLVFAAVLFFNMERSGEDSTFATMEKTRAAKWESGNLPTAEGARLGEGSLRLAEGLATLRFDSGAEVVLEAPVEIQLVDQMNCVLTRGTAVAEVPESAFGFQIATPTANVVDYGTRFAVNVDSNSGATETQVFEGVVEVEHPMSNETVRLEAGQRNYVAGDEVSEASSVPEEGDWAQSLPVLRRGSDWTMVPTAKDAYVMSYLLKEHNSEELLLVKNSGTKKGPSRKAYLGFELGSLNLDELAEAELILHFDPTGWGLASHVPDSEFTVFGLKEAGLDGWSKVTMTWENAPANVLGHGAHLQSDAVEKLGTFRIEQGVARGAFGISGSALVEFLQAQTDEVATLIVVRTTEEELPGGLVHGFASRRHPFLPPPMLSLRVAE
ncbi:MAG: FecR domain-containing protein [Verrucomicrobiota bacterium]